MPSLALGPVRCRIEFMTDRPKRPRGPNQLAKFIVDLATGEKADGTATLRRGGTSRSIWPNDCRIASSSPRAASVPAVADAFAADVTYASLIELFGANGR